MPYRSTSFTELKRGLVCRVTGAEEASQPLVWELSYAPILQTGN